MNAEVFVGFHCRGADGTSGFPQIVEEQFSVNFWFFDAAPFAFAVCAVAVWSKVAELFAAFAANSLSLASRSFAVFADNVLRALFWRVRFWWRWWIFLAASSKNANNQRKQQNHD